MIFDRCIISGGGWKEYREDLEKRTGIWCRNVQLFFFQGEGIAKEYWSGSRFTVSLKCNLECTVRSSLVACPHTVQS